MIQQYRHVVAFAYIVAHAAKLPKTKLRRKRRGIYPKHRLKEPAPVVGIASLNESSIALAIKPWVKVEDFVSAQAEIYQAVIENFREKKIEIPVPRHDIHLLNPLP